MPTSSEWSTDQSSYAGSSSTVSPYLPLFPFSFSSSLNRKGNPVFVLLIPFLCPFLTLLFYFFSVVRPEGKGSRPHVFSLVPNASMRAGPLLDVAANSQEELKEWMAKIREVTMTSEAKVNTCITELTEQFRRGPTPCHIVGSKDQSWLVFGP